MMSIPGYHICCSLSLKKNGDVISIPVLVINFDYIRHSLPCFLANGCYTPRQGKYRRIVVNDSVFWTELV